MEALIKMLTYHSKLIFVVHTGILCIVPEISQCYVIYLIPNLFCPVYYDPMTVIPADPIDSSSRMQCRVYASTLLPQMDP